MRPVVGGFYGEIGVMIGTEAEHLLSFKFLGGSLIADRERATSLQHDPTIFESHSTPTLWSLHRSVRRPLVHRPLDMPLRRLL